MLSLRELSIACLAPSDRGLALSRQLFLSTRANRTCLSGSNAHVAPRRRTASLAPPTHTARGRRVSGHGNTLRSLRLQTPVSQSHLLVAPQTSRGDRSSAVPACDDNVIAETSAQPFMDGVTSITERNREIPPYIRGVSTRAQRTRSHARSRHLDSQGRSQAQERARQHGFFSPPIEL